MVRVVIEATPGALMASGGPQPRYRVVGGRGGWRGEIDSAVLRAYFAAQGVSVTSPDATDRKLAALALRAAASDGVLQDARRTTGTWDRAKAKQASPEGRAAVEALTRTRPEAESHEGKFAEIVERALLHLAAMAASIPYASHGTARRGTPDTTPPARSGQGYPSVGAPLELAPSPTSPPSPGRGVGRRSSG